VEKISDSNLGFSFILPIYHHPRRGWRQTTLHVGWSRNYFENSCFIGLADVSTYGPTTSTTGCLLTVATTLLSSLPASPPSDYAPGHWETTREWVPGAWERVWVPGHYDRWRNWVAGHYEDRQNPGYYLKRRVWVEGRYLDH
jgi:hypothetical protein